MSKRRLTSSQPRPIKSTAGYGVNLSSHLLGRTIFALFGPVNNLAAVCVLSV